MCGKLLRAQSAPAQGTKLAENNTAVRHMCPTAELFASFPDIASNATKTRAPPRVVKAVQAASKHMRFGFTLLQTTNDLAQGKEHGAADLLWAALFLLQAVCARSDFS